MHHQHEDPQSICTNEQQSATKPEMYVNDMLNRSNIRSQMGKGDSCQEARNLHRFSI